MGSRAEEMLSKYDIPLMELAKSAVLRFSTAEELTEKAKDISHTFFGNDAKEVRLVLSSLSLSLCLSLSVSLCLSLSLSLSVVCGQGMPFSLLS